MKSVTLKRLFNTSDGKTMLVNGKPRTIRLMTNTSLAEQVKQAKRIANH